MRRILVSITAAIILLFAVATQAFAHHVTSISGTVDCDGFYAITVTGDVFNNTKLLVWLDGELIFEGPTEQAGSANGDTTYGPFVGDGAEAGMSIEANTSEGNDYASGILVLSQESCPTATPVPSPTATPSSAPSPTPSATATPTTSSSGTPEPTPTILLPNTSMADPVEDSGEQSEAVLIFVLFAAFVAVYTAGLSNRK